MPEQQDIEFEFVFAPQDEGGYHVYAPDLPGLHTQGEDIDEAMDNAHESLVLYLDGLRKIPSQAVATLGADGQEVQGCKEGAN